jgi:hypothetical protein
MSWELSLWVVTGNDEARKPGLFSDDKVVGPKSSLNGGGGKACSKNCVEWDSSTGAPAFCVQPAILAWLSVNSQGILCRKPGLSHHRFQENCLSPLSMHYHDSSPPSAAVRNLQSCVSPERTWFLGHYDNPQTLSFILEHNYAHSSQIIRV